MQNWDLLRAMPPRDRSKRGAMVVGRSGTQSQAPFAACRTALRIRFQAEPPITFFALNDHSGLGTSSGRSLYVAAFVLARGGRRLAR